MDIPVLIIEDDPDHQFLALRQLATNGLTDVKIVESVEAAIEACAERPRDVMVMDSGAVGEDLFDAVARLRRCAPKARIVGYSGDTRTGEWADAHFVKDQPFDDLVVEIRKGSIN